MKITLQEGALAVLVLSSIILLKLSIFTIPAPIYLWCHIVFLIMAAALMVVYFTSKVPLPARLAMAVGVGGLVSMGVGGIISILVISPWGSYLNIAIWACAVFLAHFALRSPKTPQT